MSAKSYTYADIERIRAALQVLHPYSGPIPTGGVHGDDRASTHMRIDSWRQVIEEKTRTIMLAGLSAEEIEAAAKAKLIEYNFDGTIEEYNRWRPK